MGNQNENRRRHRVGNDMELYPHRTPSRQASVSHRRKSNQMRQDTYADPRRIAMRKKMAKKKAMRRRRRRRILSFLLLFMVLGCTYASAKIWTKLELWQEKSEKSDFVISTAAQERVRDMIHVAVFGTDEEGFRADVNMLVSFHIKTKKLSIISVPRDTRVIMTDEMKQFLNQNGRTVPVQNGVTGQCKLTELHAYAGEGNRCAFSVAMLEQILGVPIDYYVKFDLNAFREVVDAVGGVDFYVPQDMYWDMRDTGGPLIDLKKGMQHLNGKKAEQLVRFREGYAAKDLRRIEVQQDFIMALIEKICSSSTLLSRLDDLLEVALDCTESNITIGEALKYVKYVKDFDTSNVTSDTVPFLGDPGRYVELDMNGVRELVELRIFGMEPMAEEELTTNG